MELTYRTLERFGLNEKEIQVYLACLKQDITSPYQLSKITKIPRTTIYDILLNLSLKGLVQLEQSDGFTKQQTKVKANNPSVLRKILQDKRNYLVDLELDVVDILPSLKQDFHKEKANVNFKFYPGVEGLRKLYRDRSFDLIEAERYTWDLLMPMDMIGHEEINRIVDAQNEAYKLRKYPSKEIVSLNDWTKHVLSYQYGRNPLYIENREIRYIENPVFNLSVELNIVGNVIRIACANGEENWGLSMNSISLSSTLKSIFLLEWDRGTPVTKELVESWGPNEMIEYEKRRDK
ncbi:MAG: Transcriptional regulator, TrmB [candidate division WS6 bacterium GW2011_GWF2_39_15]|uniref:Transcriptional regulator, TrmB n=1 Tax=candidate division WS6 bacterium GW2011_GWF2_39_15 TaxID=1619100 RepID=A0A0G0Q7G4_9BACT|nr:MAG: Transcriptional regulator, TrmB [candidate division WS6 bacterium GW2011_GWF2_39_15]